MRGYGSFIRSCADASARLGLHAAFATPLIGVPSPSARTVADRIRRGCDAISTNSLASGRHLLVGSPTTTLLRVSDVPVLILR